MCRGGLGSGGSGLGIIFYPTRQSRVCKPSIRWPSVKVVRSGGRLIGFGGRVNRVYPVNRSIKQKKKTNNSNQSTVGWRSCWRRGGDDGDLTRSHQIRRDLSRSHQIRWVLIRSGNHSQRRPPHRLLQLRRTSTSTPPSPASPQPTSTTKVNSDDFLSKNPNPEKKKKQRVRIESRGETEKGVESGGEKGEKVRV